MRLTAPDISHSVTPDYTAILKQKFTSNLQPVSAPDNVSFSQTSVLFEVCADAFCGALHHVVQADITHILRPITKFGTPFHTQCLEKLSCRFCVDWKVCIAALKITVVLY